MEEGEHELCLAGALLELREKPPLQVQMQLLEEMQDMEALVAEVVLVAMEAEVILVQILADQEQMEVLVEREVMGAVAEEGAEVGLFIVTPQEQEM